ncbi:MAG: helix-turn-helix transcriptional regulator [Planctomycetes bacterium]|nr:helix-turn-helix transcriptional regulator [Planctomycetota bacterium]
MRRKTPQQYEARARIARALAHPTRLLLLDLLKERETCVCDLTEIAGVDQSTVSKHLAILRDAGLVAGRKEGAMTFYRQTASCLEGFFGCLETVLRENLASRSAVI